MSGFLGDVIAERREQVGRDKAEGRRVPRADGVHTEARVARFFDTLEAAADRVPKGRPHAVIAEIKRRSPSRGDLAPDLDPAALALAYEHAGACAISVLTEPSRFGGSYEDLAAVSHAANVPALCKDFVVDRYQLQEARAAGADLVLLMVSVLGDETARFVALARHEGLEPLVEVHTFAELAVALRSRCRLIGVNNRDLRTLRVDLDVSRRLLPSIPSGMRVVVESGLAQPADLDDLAERGAHAFLIGEALVTAHEPGAALRRLSGTPDSEQGNAQDRPAPSPCEGRPS